MTISRMQQPRQMYGLGSLVKSVTKGAKKLVSGAVDTVKDVAKSDVGKLALLAAGTYGLGGGTFFGKSLPFLKNTGGFAFGNILPNLGGIMGLKSGKDNLLGNVLKVGGAGTILGGALSGMGGEDEEATIGGERNVEALRAKLTQAYRNLRYPEEQIPGLVENDLAEYTMGAGGYAEGGRIGYGMGSIVSNFVQQNPELFKSIRESKKFSPSSFSGMKGMVAKLIKNNPEIFMNLSSEEDEEDRNMVAYGGRMQYAMGNRAEQNAMQASGIMNLPLNQNPAGVTELDLRDSGGFIPPVGVKEKADDIPAMLSNNEFVFTADAVRGMGDGDVNKGAQRMYDMMKKLENGGRV